MNAIDIFLAVITFAGPRVAMLKSDLNKVFMASVYVALVDRKKLTTSFLFLLEVRGLVVLVKLYHRALCVTIYNTTALGV